MRRDALRGEDALLSRLTQALGWVEGADDVELGYEGGARHHARSGAI